MLPRTVRFWAYGRPMDPHNGYNGLVGIVENQLRSDSDRVLDLPSSAAKDDRAGAALGLAEMGATEQGPAIAALLTHAEDESVRSSAIVALVMLGTGARFADAIARVMPEEDGADGVTALYALAASGAKSQADAMAKAIERPSHRGDVA
jgi:hypothetical protein